jgi:hypothetical protein
VAAGAVRGVTRGDPMEFLLFPLVVAAYLLAMGVTMVVFADDLLTTESLPLAVVAGYFWPLVLAYGLTRWGTQAARQRLCGRG